jgi:hypothetical protein
MISLTLWLDTIHIQRPVCEVSLSLVLELIASLSLRQGLTAELT